MNRRKRPRAAVLATIMGSVLAPSLAQAQVRDSLRLACSGQAVVRQEHSTAKGHVRTSTLHPKLSLFVEIGPAVARIRIPEALVPGALSRDDGWTPLTDVAVSDTQISARIHIGPFSRTRIVIDRVHGVFDTEGLAEDGFSGACQADTSAKPQF